MAMETTILGYPRIGGHRELKKATESWWAGRVGRHELEQTGARLRRETWERLHDAGLSTIPSNTFSWYDHVLDAAVLFGAVPGRFSGLTGLEAYFAMARGTDGVAPLEMTKWFDTNYHYLVPELGPDTVFQLAAGKPLQEYREARSLGIETRPVLLGPLSLLLLSKPAEPDFSPLALLDPLLESYAQLLAELRQAGAEWVQLDEPVLAADRTGPELAALERSYDRLGALAERPAMMVATYFGEIAGALPVLAASPVEAISLDFAAGPGNREALARAGGIGGKTLVAGVIDGRNVWRADLPAALSMCASLLGLAEQLVVSTSCSLLHVPLDLRAETSLPGELTSRLAFARQKVDEVVALGHALAEGPAALPAGPGSAAARAVVNGRVRARLDALGAATSRVAYAGRRLEQADGLPILPTTTIGSFPQTEAIRKARAGRNAGRISDDTYDELMRAEIDRVIALQEDIGLDVLVHGEPERNDMVQYFAEQLDGYAATEQGWVQSYGTRYVRPPILHGDVDRPEPMTVSWATYAQSRTAKPVKGMLTGPITMLAWSFVRDDQPVGDTARQVALALRDEIHDLEAAGIRIIQVDEPALRELLPLRQADHQDYLRWAVGAFRLATSGAAASTQIHTHMCYCEFGEIIGAIEELDADVTSIEAARSHMELLAGLRGSGYTRGIGPGVYDIHSPRVPSVAEMTDALLLALQTVEPGQLWVNPDCGLKTRAYAEAEPALRNLVAAAQEARSRLRS
jgi:5-methyltetrahydropteroyltriglutamate--homocysteine methyltransferase